MYLCFMYAVEVDKANILVKGLNGFGKFVSN